ncbi:MAG: glycosyltransferase [Candidatus Hodarchaeales archaeon]
MSKIDFYTSVIVCTYNGSKTIKETLDNLSKLDYPHFEVIIVNDGSTDQTPQIINEYVNKYGFKLKSIENNGLSNARNIGYKLANSEIVAYIDDDAYPDPQWLKYLAYDFMNTEFAGIGGPNIGPDSDGFITKCISNAPGNPMTVLISDREAEHLAGCNMAFRKSALEEVNGFDSKFRIAGDDVDLCWMLIKNGFKLGFSPSALVWHHRRNSIRTFLKQQHNYGKAESLLEEKWPQKYTAEGNISWIGRIYGAGYTGVKKSFGSKIYHGVWGTAGFQSLYQQEYGKFSSALYMPEWSLVIGILIFLTLLGVFWTPLLVFLPLLIISIAAPIILAVRNANHSLKALHLESTTDKNKFIIVTSCLNLLQPIARLLGRVQNGLTPWRSNNNNARIVMPWPIKTSFWNENWIYPEDRLQSIEKYLIDNNFVVKRGDSFDNWDLEVRGGLFGSSTMLMESEDHEDGMQLSRFKITPKVSNFSVFILFLFISLMLFSGLNQSWTVFSFLGFFTIYVIYCTIRDCGQSGYINFEAIKENNEKVL